MDKKQLKGSALLLLTAFIWGVAFVAQSVGMDYVGPFTFISVRFLIGGVVLLPFIWFRDRGGQKSLLTGADRNDRGAVKQLLLGGLVCGLALVTGASFQQIGIVHTTVGKAGFVSALYIVFVPILGIFLKKIPGVKIWISVALSAVGLYLLCMTEGFRLSTGDAYVFICAVTYAVHILVVDHFTKKVEPVRLSCAQFFVCGGISFVLMMIYETPSWQALLDAAVPLLYAGVLSSGVAFTLQVVAQKDTNPTVASLLMSLESVFSVLAGWVLLQEALSGREIWGCVLMFGAIILSQLPERKARRV